MQRSPPDSTWANQRASLGFSINKGQSLDPGLPYKASGLGAISPAFPTSWGLLCDERVRRTVGGYQRSGPRGRVTHEAQLLLGAYLRLLERSPLPAGPNAALPCSSPPSCGACHFLTFACVVFVCLFVYCPFVHVFISASLGLEQLLAPVDHDPVFAQMNPELPAGWMPDSPRIPEPVNPLTVYLTFSTCKVETRGERRVPGPCRAVPSSAQVPASPWPWGVCTARDPGPCSSQGRHGRR